ncbi:MAG TPA: plastocyanin/azurin family copper-binding protein [Gaiellaceae bacterium]|nr:plastocyanin/azurin family copper-binding protein [Gaiellaceae bacterium]
MLLLGLSTGHKIGLGLAVLGFAGFSLIVSLLVPRWYPEFPGRGLRVFIAACLLLFVGMMSAVIVLARESKAAEAKGTETTTTQATTTTATTTTSATTGTTTSAPTSVPVSETEFKIALPKTTVAAGSYSFEVKNDGKIDHDLVIQGNGVDEKTPTIAPGASATLNVDLKPGSYDVYCSVPGHKQAGMDVKLTVS